MVYDQSGLGAMTRLKMLVEGGTGEKGDREG